MDWGGDGDCRFNDDTRLILLVLKDVGFSMFYFTYHGIFRLLANNGGLHAGAWLPLEHNSWLACCFMRPRLKICNSHCTSINLITSQYKLTTTQLDTVFNFQVRLFPLLALAQKLAKTLVVCRLILLVCWLGRQWWLSFQWWYSLNLTCTKRCWFLYVFTYLASCVLAWRFVTPTVYLLT